VHWLDTAEPVVERWLARRGSMRSVVRQELASQFLMGHLPSGRVLRVLDVGCGDGAQALRLAAAGHQVVGVDPDDAMLAALTATLDEAGPDLRSRVHVLRGSIDDLPTLVDPDSFDAVLCHGVLMYLADPAAAVATMAGLVVPGGVLSLLVRNQANIAMRAGRAGQWAAALRALRGETAYVNNLGALARADSLPALTALVEGLGMDVDAWYGVRVLSDLAHLEEAPPADPGELAALLEAEALAGSTDPYRQVAPLVQVVARRPTGHLSGRARGRT
jgi:S-adenosylmethionine-dependent methyltransferase